VTDDTGKMPERVWVAEETRRAYDEPTPSSRGTWSPRHEYVRVAADTREIDRKFYELVVKERDYERLRNSTLERSLAEAEKRAERWKELAASAMGFAPRDMGDGHPNDCSCDGCYAWNRWDEYLAAEPAPEDRP